MPLLEVAEAENWVQLAVLEVMKIGLMLILRLVIGSCFFFSFFPFFPHLGGCGISSVSEKFSCCNFLAETNEDFFTLVWVRFLSARSQLLAVLCR
jgi:hypothetical protein